MLSHRDTFPTSTPRTEGVYKWYNVEGKRDHSCAPYPADKDFRFRSRRREHNVFLISPLDSSYSRAPADFLGRRDAGDDGITVKIARRKRKLADAKRKSTMGRRRCLVVRKERGNGHPPLFGHTRMGIMRWKRSWKKVGEKWATGALRQQRSRGERRRRRKRRWLCWFNT